MQYIFDMTRHRSYTRQHPRPFWLPASNYYVMAAAVTIGIFFLVWGILEDGGDEKPFIQAGIGSSIALALAVALREVILRNARDRYLSAQRRMDRTMRALPTRRIIGNIDDSKLTLERNAAILRTIGKKSEAAKVLEKFSEGHREVFELCEKYLSAVERELPNVGVGSPRLSALRKGSKIVGEYHHYHLLQMTEIDAKNLAQKSKSHAKVSDKLNTAEQALCVVEFALNYYPHDASLKDSQKALSDLVSSIKVSNLIDRAERARSKGNYDRAVSLYNDALSELGRSQFLSDEQKAAAGKIEAELEAIKSLSDKN